MIEEHESAVDSDLLHASGRGIEDLGSSLSWQAASSILHNLSLDSALARDVNPDTNLWNSTLKTNYILADIFDVLSAIHYTLIKIAGGKAQKPKSYPRPNDKRKEVKKIGGKGAMKVEDLKKWIFKKRKGA